MKVTMDELVNYCKQYGFIFQGSEIYNGLANSWDYGPVGTNLKENIRRAWKKKFIQENPYNVGLDAALCLALHFLQSINGSAKEATWPDATQTFGFIIIAASSPTL